MSKISQLKPGPRAAVFCSFSAPNPESSSGKCEYLTLCIFSLSGLPDLPPALLPAPSKRARPSPGRPLPHDEDPEERLNRHDEHITAVLSKIVVRVSPAEWGRKGLGVEGAAER